MLCEFYKVGYGRTKATLTPMLTPSAHLPNDVVLLRSKSTHGSRKQELEEDSLIMRTCLGRRRISKSRLSSVASAPVFDYSTASRYPTPLEHRSSETLHPTSNSFIQTGTISSRRRKLKDYGQISLLVSSTPQTALMPPAPLSETTTSTESEPETWQCTFCCQ
jgi:hypothetical protein